MNALYTPRTPTQIYARKYWVEVQRNRKAWLAASSLQQLLAEILKGITSWYGNCSCNWYQVGAFAHDPVLEPVDLALLARAVSGKKPSRIDVCLLLAERRVVWASNQNGLVLEYAVAEQGQQPFALLRLGDPHFGMDHWILIELESKGFICDDQLICESLVETLACIYLERAHWFHVNRRLAIQFDRAFTNAKHSIVLDSELQPVAFCEHELNADGSPMSFVESKMLLGILIDRLSQWDSDEAFRRENQTRIASFAFRLGFMDIVALVKYDALSREWKVVLNVDTMQCQRSEKARRLLTRRQFEAFLHFENGCVDAVSLAKRMGIASRTAERYRAIIIHHVENELSVC